MKPLGLLVFLATATGASAADWSLQPASSLQKLTARTPGVLEAFQSQPVRLRAVRGEWECFQVVATAGERPIEKLEIRTDGFASIAADSVPPSQFQIYRENFVYVPRPSGNRNLRKLWWPDGLIPLDHAPASIEANQSAVYWIAVHIPAGATATDYFGELQVTADGTPKRLALGLKVDPITLPAQTMRANAALYYGTLRDWYARQAGRTYTDAEWAVQQKRYYDFLLDYGINAYDLPVSWGTPAAEAYLRDSRVRAVRVPPLDSPDFQTAFVQLKATGSLSKAYYYYIDEPQPERFPEVRRTTERLRALGIKHCVTVHPNETLKDAVDIWCPNVGDFFGINHVDFQALAAERKKGRETWWYTMVEPKYPYPTWLLDDDAHSVRDYGLIMARYGITGFVYSMVHGWGPKPWEDLTSFAGTSGDGTLIYPGEPFGVEGPLPSIRLMLLRDAIEDYELGKRLAQNQPDDFSFNRNTLLDKLVESHRSGLVSSWFSGVKSNDFFPFRSKPSREMLTIRSWRGSPPKLDGALNDDLWRPGSRWPDQVQWEPTENRAPQGTQLWTGVQNDVLYVAVSASNASASEWLAVDLAPEDIENDPERFRFVITPRGTVVAERHTREGHFQVEVPGLKGAALVEADSWTAEFAIPLRPLDLDKGFRFNARRRTADRATGTKITLSAYADGGDPWGMPIVKMR